MKRGIAAARLVIAAFALVCCGKAGYAAPDDAKAAAQTQPTIERKSVPPRHYFYSRHAVASLDEVTRIEWAHSPRVLKKARSLGLEASGGLEYHVYFRQPMYVDVALPVARIPPDADMSQYKTTASFDCLSLVFTGSPLDLAAQWARVQQEIATRGHSWSEENREVLISREGFDATRHVTELQAGIGPAGGDANAGVKPSPDAAGKKPDAR